MNPHYQPRHPRLEDSGDLIFSLTELHTPGLTRTISTFAGKLKVTIRRNGERAGGFTFRGDELCVVADAVRLASSRPDRRCVSVGVVTTRGGSTIEIGASADAVCFRTTLPDGRKTRTTTIAGEELDALRRAVEEDLNVAARAAYRREDSIV